MPSKLRAARIIEDWYAHISAALLGYLDVRTEANRPNPSSQSVISVIGALRTTRREDDSGSVPGLESSCHASGSISDISTKSKSKIRFTKRAGSVATGSNDSCTEIAGSSGDCCSGVAGPAPPSGVNVGISVPDAGGVLEGGTLVESEFEPIDLGYRDTTDN